MSGGYDKKYYEGCESGYKSGYSTHGHQSFTDIVVFIVGQLGLPLRLIDIGCALGSLVAQAVEGGVDAYGVDFSAYAVKEARKNSLIQQRVFECRAEEVRKFFKDDSFDAVTMIDVLEHLPHPETAIREAFLLLRPNGHLIIHTAWGPTDPYAIGDTTHVSVKSLTEWRNILLTNGFTVKAPYWMGAAPSINSRWWIKLICRFPFGKEFYRRIKGRKIHASAVDGYETQGQCVIWARKMRHSKIRKTT